MSNPILNFEFNKNHSYDNSGFHHFFYLDSYQNVLSKEKYKFAKSFYDGYAFVYKYDKSWDIINTVGDSAINKFKFSRIIKIALNHIAPKDKFFIKNYVVRHNLIISVNCYEIKKEFDALNIKLKYFPKNLNRQGFLLINRYDSGMLLSLIEDYSLPGNGLIAIKHFDEDWGFISVESFNRHWLDRYKFEQRFDFASGFVSGLAKVKKNGYYGFIDTNGNFVINPIYDDARSFSKGFAAVAIANCRQLDGWKEGQRKTDLAWNFIDKNNKKYLQKSKENLSSIDKNLNYYFEDSSSMYTSAYENLNPNYFNELRLEGIGCSNNFIGRPHSDFWYNSNILGQLSPSYITEFLTAQITDELGFKGWFGSYYNIINRREKLKAETIFIDFDTTQTELDFINDSNSLEIKYGTDYTSNEWKSMNQSENFNSRSNYDDITDWSNYNDNLDMDQQDVDFWNQF